MGKPTGQLQEDTQELLDFYNSHYNWEYNDMCRFNDNHTEREFQEYYETYNRLCDDYGTELVDNFGLYYDLDASYYEKFEDMYEGHFETGQDFAFYYVNEVDETTKNIPNWVTIDYADIWENKLSEDQFETLFNFVNDKVDSIVNASVDYNDSEILNEWEDLLDVHTVLEEANKWVTITEDD